MCFRGTAVIALGALLLSACGRFTVANSARTSTSASYTGQTLPPLATTSTTAPAGGRSNTAATSPTRTTRESCAPPNQSVRDDPSGFRLILTVSPRQCVKQSDDLTLRLEIENISKRPLQYDSNQNQFFDIYPVGDANRPTWTDTSCRGAEAHPAVGGPITLDPGERAVRADAVYPGPKSYQDREKCRILGGDHEAVAHLVLAGGDTIQSAPLLMKVS